MQKMENLNAENIINEIQSLIKALKDCGGWVKRGNGEGWFNHEILADALSLIKELTEENEKLNASCTELARKCASLNEENEKLKLGTANSDVAKLTAKDINIDNSTQLKFEIVKKMQERLTTFFENDDYIKYVEVDAEYINEQITKVAKEMLEGLK